MSPAGRLALITGGGRRLGASITRHLTQQGYRAAIHCHTSAQEAHALAREITAAGGRADVFTSDFRQGGAAEILAREVEERCGPVDLLVHGASTFPRGGLADTPEHILREAMAVEVITPAALTRALLPGLRERRGQVVWLSDLAGSRGWPRWMAHSVAKAAALELVRLWAVELAPEIRVNALSLGIVSADPGESWEAALRHVPLGRPGEIEDVLRALDYLLGASYVTGEILHVDGGRGRAP